MQSIYYSIAEQMVLKKSYIKCDRQEHEWL